MAERFIARGTAPKKYVGLEGVRELADAAENKNLPGSRIIVADFVREHVKAEEMISTQDIAESVRFLLRTSPACVVPEIVFQRPGEAL